MHNEESAENSYIQGAGDDSEGWSQGLTPAVFWQFSQELLKSTDHALPDFICELISRWQRDHYKSRNVTFISPAQNIYLGSLSAEADLEGFDGVVICSETDFRLVTEEERGSSRAQILQLHCKTGKLGSRALREKLSEVVEFIRSLASRTWAPKILFACQTGKDLSVGVALTVLCLFFDDSCKCIR